MRCIIRNVMYGQNPVAHIRRKSALLHDQVHIRRTFGIIGQKPEQLRPKEGHENVKIQCNTGQATYWAKLQFASGGSFSHTVIPPVLELAACASSGVSHRFKFTTAWSAWIPMPRSPCSYLYAHAFSRGKSPIIPGSAARSSSITWFSNGVAQPSS